MHALRAPGPASWHGMACWLPRVSGGLIVKSAARGEVGELRYVCAVGARVRARVYGRKAGNFTNFTTRPETAVSWITEAP